MNVFSKFLKQNDQPNKSIQQILKNFLNSNTNLIKYIQSMRIKSRKFSAPFILTVLVQLVFLLSQCQSPQTNLLYLTQGQNQYFDIDKYFYKYQNITISDMTNSENAKDYRLCFVGQAQKPYFEILQNQTIFPLPTQSSTSAVLYDLDQVIKMDKIVSSYFSYRHQLLYLLTTNQLMFIELQNSKIKKTQKTKLSSPINKGQLIKINGMLVVMTVEKILRITQTKDLLQLKQMNKLVNQTQQYISIFQNNASLVFASDNSLYVSEATPLQGQQFQNKFHRVFRGFEGSIQSVFYFNRQLGKDFLLVFDDQRLYLTFNTNFKTNQPLNFVQFNRLTQTNKCTKAHKWLSYLFLECRNHLLYIESKDITDCNNGNLGQIQNCFNNLKFRHVNVGYHIQSIEFTKDWVDRKILITGIQKYQLRYILTQKKMNPQHFSIVSIIPLSTYYPKINLNKVYLLDLNSSLIISTNTLSIGRQFSQKKQLFCRTVDENSQTLLDQPTGNFNGVLTVQGFCLDLVQQNQFTEIINQEMCRIRDPIIVKVNAEISNYQFIWYILVGVIAAFTLATLIYCLIKKRKLKQQYQKFENQKQHGHQVLQQNMVTESNQQYISQN